MSKIRPLGDRVVVKRAEPETMTKGGIVIPDNASEKSIEGIVMAVGPGKTFENGTHREINLKKNDRILFGKYAGTEVKLQGEELLVLREEDILGVIEG